MRLKVEDCLGIMAEIAPLEFAEPWDPVGLQVGHPQQPVRCIGVALDATFDVVLEAIREGVDFLVVHHPLFFRPLKRLDLSTAAGRIVQAAIQNNLSIYAAHTNLDSVSGGLNDALCRKLGLENVQVLPGEKRRSETLLHVDVPAGMKTRVHAVLEEAGTGVSWWVSMDRERGLSRCRLASDRVKGLTAKLHALCPDAVMDSIPAGDGGTGAGLGRVGTLASPLSLEAFAEMSKKALGLSHVRRVGDALRQVHRVAVCTGSGAGLMTAARSCGADVLLTGDVKYHEAMDALDEGFLLVDAGHFGTEYQVVDLLTDRLSAALENRGLKKIPIVSFSSRKDPFCTV